MNSRTLGLRSVVIGPMVIEPIVPLWSIVLFFVLLGSFFIWMEVLRKGPYLFWRMVSHALVMIALAGLFLRPGYRFEKPNAGVLLLTKGYDKAIVDSLLTQHPLLHILRTSDANDFPSSRLVVSLFDLPEAAGPILFVVGEGIPAYAQDGFQNTTFSYFPDRQPEGVTELTLKSAQVNQRNELHGEFKAKRGITLQLIGPGGIEDSVTFLHDGINPFSLSFVPRESGTFLYSLAAREEGRIVSVENLPIDILPQRKLNILFLQAYPTFEARYLKNFLASKGHALLLRYQVSKNLFRYEFANREPLKLDRLLPSVLHSVDLLIIDSSTWKQLTPADRHAIQEAVDDGLGIIILMDHISDANTFKPFISLATTTSKTDTAVVTLPSREKINVAVSPVYLKSDPAIRSVSSTNNGRVLSGYQHKGLGRSGFQFIRETYGLILKGRSKAYAEIWSPLIEKTARHKNDSYTIRITSPFPWHANEPIPIEIVSSQRVATLLVDGIPVPVKEDVSLDNVWHGKIWAGAPGWHQLLSPQDSTHLNFYVSANQQWSTLAHSHRTQLNKLRNANSLPTEREKEYSMKTISPLFFFLLFVLASAFLWLVPKMN